ncbi:MAG: hypothetical protein JRJ85_01755 [Deltaproteobacteria bacterium]|nr:hypothetical protein [Deltaproteobacteria bacterium]
MNSFEYIFSKQVCWAQNQGIDLVGSKGSRGRPAYTKTLDENLFEPLIRSVFNDFNDGDGGELNGNLGSPPKMHAVHSSSALGVNIFHYWLRINEIPKIAAACRLCSKNNTLSQNIRFEKKYPISSNFRYSPNIDVVIENSLKSKYKVFAVECKFSEAYSSRRHAGIDQKYLQLESIWDDIPHLLRFAKTISPDDHNFFHLHPAQLVKHILGLKQKFNKNGFRLLYLWYDVLGHDGAVHRNEIDIFSEVTKSDGIKFHALSYQDLVVKLSKGYRNEHPEYIQYVSERYL